MYDIQTGMDSDTAPKMLDINQAPEKKDKGNGPSFYVYGPGEEDKVRMVEKIYREHKQYRKKYDKNWLDNYKLFRGDQWKFKRPDYRHSEVINLVFQTIQSTVPMQTDARPKFEYIPPEPKDQRLADILNMLATSDWEKQQWQYILLEIVYDCNLYSCSWGHVGWDEKALDGLGQIVFESEDPFVMYPDPNARDVNDEGRRSRRIVKAEAVDVEILKERYPKYADFIKSDLSEFKDQKRNFSLDQDEPAYETPLSDIELSEPTGYRDSDKREQALEITLMMKSKETVTEEVEQEVMVPQPDPVTGEVIQVPTVQKVPQKRLKYPKGRKIVVVNKIPVFDGPCEYEDGKFPYFKHVNYILPREFYGVPEVEQIKGPQRIFNTLISYALDCLILMGNPIWVIDTDSQVDEDNLFNKPGLIVQKRPGSEVRREEGTQLQPYVLDLINKIKTYVDDIAGSQDVSRGAVEGVTAARAIESLQEAANTRVRQKARILDKALNQLGVFYASRVFQYYDAPRIFRLTGEDGLEQWFKFHVDKEKNQAIFQEVVGTTEKDPEFIDLVEEFDVRVTTGSSLTIAKREKFNKAVALYDKKALSKRTLLETADVVSNVDQELQRIQEEEMMAAQAQMQAQAQQIALQGQQQAL